VIFFFFFFPLHYEISNLKLGVLTMMQIKQIIKIRVYLLKNSGEDLLMWQE